MSTLKEKSMTQGNPFKLLLSFSLPLMLGNVFQQLYTVVDTAIVGRGVGMEALAALGGVDWLNWMILGLVQGFTQGFSVRVAQKYGEGDKKGLKAVIGQSALLSVFIAVIALLLIQTCLPLFFFILRIPTELSLTAEIYTRVFMLGLPAVVLYNFTSAVLRAVGNSKTPLIAMVIAAFTNIILDIVTVFVFDWGVAGAAVASVFAQLLSGIICAIKILRTPELCFSKKDMKLEKYLCFDMMRLGSPMAIKNVIIAVGGMAVQAIVNGFDVSFIAGFTATNKLYGILEIAAISYGYAVTTYVGQNYGANKYDRIKSGMKAAVTLSLITSAFIASMMIIFGRFITMLFISSEDASLVEAAGNTAYSYLVVMSLFLPTLYLLYAYISALQGIGNTVWPMKSGIIEFFMRVGISVLVGFIGISQGIFFAEVSAWVGAAVYLIIGYYKYVDPLIKKHRRQSL